MELWNSWITNSPTIAPTIEQVKLIAAWNINDFPSWYRKIAAIDVFI